MKPASKKTILRIILHIILFFLISLIYFSPDVLEGKKLYQHDVMQFQGMSKEIIDYRNEYHEETLWTNSMFGGMPAYLISVIYHGNKTKILHQILSVHDWRPFNFIFLYLIGSYIALLLFGVSPWLSFAGAIAYAFSSYFIA